MTKRVTMTLDIDGRIVQNITGVLLEEGGTPEWEKPIKWKEEYPTGIRNMRQAYQRLIGIAEHYNSKPYSIITKIEND